MNLSQLRTLTKQALGNRVITTDSDGWYTDRVNSAYARIALFNGPTKVPGRREPRMRTLRFFELMDAVDNSITDALTDNFVTPTSTQTRLFAVTDVYDLTNDRYLNRPARRRLRRLNPDATGIPTEWVPDGVGGVTGYRIYPRPSQSSEEIDVREYVYLYPDVLTGDGDTPVIPLNWHPPIWMAAASEGAKLLDWPEKATEMEGLFMDFLAGNKTPVEESAYSGGKRWFNVGAR